MSTNFNVKSVSVSFNIKLTTKYQSFSIGVTKEAEPIDSANTSNVVELLMRDVIGEVMQTIDAHRKEIPTLDACADNFESVGKQFRRFRECKGE